MKRKPINKATRQAVWHKYNHRCAYCGIILEYKDMQVDHISPHKDQMSGLGYMVTREGGKIDYDVDDYKNFNPACRVCNKWKSVWTVEEFRNEIQSQPSRLCKRSPGFRLAVSYELIEPTDKKVEFYFETVLKTTNQED